MIHSEHLDHVAPVQLDRPDAENRITSGHRTWLLDR
jgi:hypothetical protein